MLCHRIKQFREYHKLDQRLMANMLGIDLQRYKNFETGRETPDIDIITQLAEYYKVTVREFYGYNPPLVLQSNEEPLIFDDDEDKVSENLLKMSDLSWDEQQLILYYREYGDIDPIISEIIKKRFPAPDDNQ